MWNAKVILKVFVFVSILRFVWFVCEATWNADTKKTSPNMLYTSIYPENCYVEKIIHNYSQRIQAHL